MGFYSSGFRLFSCKKQVYFEQQRRRSERIGFEDGTLGSTSYFLFRLFSLKATTEFFLYGMLCSSSILQLYSVFLLPLLKSLFYY